MLALSRFVLRHKGVVLVFWLVVLVAGGAASAKLSSRLSPSFALPGAASYQANQQILRTFGNGGDHGQLNHGPVVHDARNNDHQGPGAGVQPCRILPEPQGGRMPAGALHVARGGPWRPPTGLDGHHGSAGPSRSPASPKSPSRIRRGAGLAPSPLLAS